VGPFAVLFGAASAACAAAAVFTRADPAVAVALEPLREEAAPGRGRWMKALEEVGRTRLGGGSSELLRRRLELAGQPWRIEAVLGAKVLLTGSAVALCLALIPLAHAAALASLPVGLAAFRSPEFVMARLAKRRQARIAAQVPDLGELLLATTQAGLTPPVAFRRAAEVLERPLADEMDSALRQIDLGVPWRQTLDEAVAHVDDPSFRRVVSTLSRAQRLGTSVTSTLRSVTDDLRSERRALAEERARRAPVKMLFPLVFLILPAFLLLTVGPVVLATIRSFR
jgi:tight adherence protein C